MTAFAFPELIAYCKEYGFIFPSSELYDGLSAVYDYGPLGAQLKKNIKDAWWKEMTQVRNNIVGIDSAIFTHPSVWQASGHIDHFADPLVDNKTSKKRYRVDHLIEQYAQALPDKNKASALLNEMGNLLHKGALSALSELLIREKIPCPVSGDANWSPVRAFNLMFSTQIGSIADQTNTLYLRPETAQGIYINFLNVQKTARMKIPFGIAQIGKAFRNEIIARQFIFRMREFEQMEMQFFIPPNTQQEWFSFWKKERMKWLEAIGIPSSKLSLTPHEQLAHYADKAEDINFAFPFGIKELEGIHSRTDFDMRSHEQLSGKKCRYFDPSTQQTYIPYVIETSLGADRLFLALISSALHKESIQDEKTSERIVLKIKPRLAPKQAALLPLVKKEPLTHIAQQLYDELKMHYHIQYDDKDSIGKRYRRQDAIGTPYCITIDYDSVEQQTATLRHRDTMQQERIPLTGILPYLNDNLKG